VEAEEAVEEEAALAKIHPTRIKIYKVRYAYGDILGSD